ncbi:vitamin K epoxide reductase family protein [Aeromicrobium sp. CnD17-E]|uniref:vitamin K epoxide reductase family protein n=1 Tax=Aeromicrobium sp. CnD17-E TaxID=2954487 RepID=UPI00209800BD|nr:vitamin K epoxide reductase family protein [Aeromicrobium sp. CnD17-E]MCO7240357.1 vitamin K epoxide reductase family protein [Aeromicrobium sp. CnD17-E]
MSDVLQDDRDRTPDTREAGDTDVRDPRWLMLVAGVVGLAAAIVLTIDKVKLLTAEAAGTDKTLNCDLNAFVSCGGVINTPQASAFGFPNPIIGIVGFTVVVTLAVLLLAGVRLPAFVWAGLQVGVLFGIGFVTWLQYQSIYDIGKLCPWCMVVWTFMIPLFVVVTARNLRAFAPRSAVTRFLSNWTLLVVVLWYVAVLSAIWFRFGENLWA